MGLKYDFDKIPLAFDMPVYANTSISSKNRSSLSKTYTSITYHQKNIYANIPTQISADASYATLLNTTSVTSSLNVDSPIADENNPNNRIYENLKSCSPIYMNLNTPEEEVPIIPPSLRKTDQKEQILLSSIETKQTVQKLEMKIVSSSNDRHRTKIPRIPSSLRRRRTFNRPRRYRRRSSTPFRAIANLNATRRQQHSNPLVHHPMTSNHRRKRSAHQSVTNQLYHKIDSPILYNSEDIFEYPLEFQQLSTNPTENDQEESIQQVISTSVQQDAEEEEEFCPHKTFEDFLLRRRPKSSCSTLASVTNTIVSSETLSSDVPPRPPPIHPRLSGIALSLDKNDVDFIHDILQRTQGDRRVSNRITALKEAYIRAASKRTDLLKNKKPIQINENSNKKKMSMRHSVIASKIRNELEKYDELPIHRKTIFDEDEDEDETYSANDHYRYYHHHRRLPPVPSTTHRIINFMTSLKQQLQKNFHEIRTRILLEAMSNSRHKHTFHHPSRRPKTSHSFIPRSSSHHSMNHSYPLQRPQFSRSHSNISQIRPPSFDKHYSNRPRTFRVTPHLQQQQPRKRIS